MLVMGKTDNQLNDPAEYHTLVSINGESTTQGILIVSYKDSLLALAMERTSDALFWEVAFSPFLKKTQDLVLHKFIPGQPPYADYYALCCAPWPDLLEFQYSIWEDDSLTNILHVDVDTGTKYLSGHFTATFINTKEPFDTVRMRCDGFECYWK
jgi:hypothetical protein